MLTSPQQSFAAAIPPRNCNFFRPLLSSSVLTQNGTSDLTRLYTASPTPNPPSTKHTTSSLPPLLLDSLSDAEDDDPQANNHKPSAPTHSNSATAETLSTPLQKLAKEDGLSYAAVVKQPVDKNKSSTSTHSNSAAAESPPTPPPPPLTHPSPSPESPPSAAPVNKLDQHDAAVEIAKDIAAADGIVGAPVHAVPSADKKVQDDDAGEITKDYTAAEITKDNAAADGGVNAPVHAVLLASKKVQRDDAIEITKDIAATDGNPSDAPVHAHANAPVGNGEAENELEVYYAVKCLVAGVASRANAAIEPTAEVPEEVSTPRPKRASSAHTSL